MTTEDATRTKALRDENDAGGLEDGQTREVYALEARKERKNAGKRRGIDFERWLSPSRLFKLLVGLVVTLLVFDGVVQWHLLATEQDHNRSRLSALWRRVVACSPQVVSPDPLSRGRFHDLLRNMKPFPPLRLQGEFQKLCDASTRQSQHFEYCLPIHGRRDEPFCTRPDRMDLLVRSTSPDSFCYASVLHMLFVDVYEELHAMNAAPIAVYGTLLGAVRNQSLIPFTEDADIAFVALSGEQLTRLRERLWQRGYHMFHATIWRICVAPSHPLASTLFTTKNGLVRDDFSVPYLDLYEMRPADTQQQWHLAGTRFQRLLHEDQLVPYGSVEINGDLYDTVADPLAFLLAEYGPEWRKPARRPPPKPFDRVEDFPTA
ncbi:hypothetical protein Poli38472_014763 [Pythium oligandrum]|uniref:Uncharacterized protein n=1 Tax=Pythium oligandrum TaxID=41045 RepID=A0A8K1FCY8_PYTOL|nr:hypothetical protein Poli38472_014763 [Pythium oligandrum]|eukprot:TMW54992.1 hypothetical protein Poli38472_014763 [Pythium oligandrum]